MDWLNIAAYVATGVTSGVITGLRASAAMARRQERLEEEVRILRDEKVAEIKTRVGRIEEKCRAEQTAGDVHNLTGWMKKLDGTLAVMTDRVTTTAAAMDGIKTWLTNLNNDYQAHQRDRTIHGGHA